MHAPKGKGSPVKPSLSRAGKSLQVAARSYAKRCFGHQTQPHAGELAQTLRVPPYQLSRDFAAATGQSPSAYLKRLQIIRAQRLLRFTNLPLNRIAYASGFGTRANFFRLFKQLTGTTPHEFRMSCKK
jgi:transcriptional regulator GlxA family with amidase domain